MHDELDQLDRELESRLADELAEAMIEGTPLAELPVAHTLVKEVVQNGNDRG